MAAYKYMFLLIILIFILLLTMRIPKEENVFVEKPLLGKVIFVDPGHGGRDPGTIFGKIYEKDINLSISKVLEEELSQLGATVFMTRSDDRDLSSEWDERKKRGDLYRRLLMMKNNSLKVDLYLSIHINWYKNAYWSGAEVLYHPINSNNEKLGSAIMNRFKSDLGSKRGLKKTNLYMYKNTTIPGVLIECGFLSNANERYLLRNKDYQVKLSRAISNGVIDYFNIIN